jgi:menaquinone-dependent protoporphyrinogen IX oxidase
MNRAWHSRPHRQGTDASRDYDYTDWDAVDAFATELARASR